MSSAAAFPVPPIIKRSRLRLTPAEAFNRFTDQIGSWWPLGTLSVSEDARSTCFIEPRAGGRIVERDPAGAQHLWGWVERWEPPHELELRWHPGRPDSEAQALHLVFEPDGTGGSVVTLTHSGWELLGQAARAVREQYARGWGLAFEVSFVGEYRKGDNDEV